MKAAWRAANSAAERAASGIGSGPNLGAAGAPRPAGGQSFYPIEKYGIKLISIGFFVTDKTPIIWRGPMVMSAVRQFLQETLWGTQDFLIVDLPPGTGDAQLTITQRVKLDGGVIVTTPQEIALADVRRGVQMFNEVEVPVLGVVENMSYYECRKCGKRHDIFAHGGGERLASGLGVPFLGALPLVREVREGGDQAMPIVAVNPAHPVSGIFKDIADKIIHGLEH